MPKKKTAPNLDFIEPAIRDLAIPIEKVKVDPENVRAHSTKNLEAIRDSLRGFRQQKPIVIRKDGTLVAGEGTLTAAINLGWTHIAAVRTTLKDAEAKAFAIADNRTTDLSEFKDDVLAIALEALREDESIDHLLAGFDDRDIDEIVRSVEPEIEIIEDDVPEPPADPVTKLGDVWLLGEHQVLCGDCTKVESVALAMDGKVGQMIFIDPPYGVDYDGGAKRRDKLKGDSVGTGIYGDSLPILAGAVDDSAALYLWYADGHAAAAAAAAAAAGYQIVAQIIWAKNHAQFVTSAHYKGKHEPCYYAHKKGRSARWYGQNNEVTLWEYDRSARNDFHPTQKPVAIAARAISNSSAVGDIVLDGFLGGGTTLIACEQLGRKCYGIEIEPKYVDVVCNRWANLTGKVPTLEADGSPFPVDSE